MINCLIRFFLSPRLYVPVLTQIHIWSSSTPTQHSLCYLSTSVLIESLLIRINYLLMLYMLCSSALYRVHADCRQRQCYRANADLAAGKHTKLFESSPEKPTNC